PNHWGTEGIITEPWTEVSSGNAPNDRRFIQSAGPFTLEPGDYNNITVGVVYARATSGDPFESVELVRIADDKAQALFDNCFEIVEGPDAPDLTIQELNRELILSLTNDNPISNNYRETKYNEDLFGFDPIVPEAIDGEPLDSAARSYQFQGYMIYQVVDEKVSPDELSDVNKARLIFQCDVQDGIDQAINFVYDPTMDQVVPTLMVDGADEGISHTFQVTNDAFATGDTRLINHKTYYFMAIAYGYNNYLDYDFVSKQGQIEQFKSSRKGSSGSIRVISAIPHDVSPEAGGTNIFASYGDGVTMTRLEGRGCGTNILEISQESEDYIVENVFADEVTYVRGGGPVDVKVIDPTRLPAADFKLMLDPDYKGLDSDSVYWMLVNVTDEDTIHAIRPFDVHDEFLLLDWGLSITWDQYVYLDDDGEEVNHFTELLSGEIEFDDPARPWLLGIEDGEGFTELNWIRAGNQSSEELEAEIIFDDEEAGNFWDADEVYEGVINGTWSPYCLVSHSGTVTLPDGSSINMVNVAPTVEGIDGDLSSAGGDFNSNIRGLNNVDVVITSDKSKWTRCAVLEMQSIPDLAQSLMGGDAFKMGLRRHASVDKNGRTVAEGGNASEAEFHGQTIGMGWFPGYAIDVETGERLNMAFGEDSWMTGDRGNDMIWNPSPREQGDLSNQVPDLDLQIFAGGQHWIYVFKNQRYEDDNSNNMPAYDGGDYVYDRLETNASNLNRRRVFQACTWVGSSLLNQDYEMLDPEDGLIPNDVRVKLRVAKPYTYYSPITSDVSDTLLSENYWAPLYSFTTRDIATETNESATLESILDEINVVPNPYYAFSEYESSKLDNRVKITNLPEVCTINIYTVNGTLVRHYDKADPTTSLDWDLKNHRNVPIAGGVYIIHIDVPGVGEKILKWFGVLRPVDLDNF
ncbi:MAG: T9SS C-terminal target domain-containing protein, partial [Flavobacteriales bacterium]|nr:T9SS C-terminal target domain-containing protein [Flavobacteriales bacterium]